MDFLAITEILLKVKKIHETVISCSNNKQSYPFQWTHKMKKNFASKKSDWELEREREGERDREWERERERERERETYI